jgi:hypothetical protein
MLRGLFGWILTLVGIIVGVYGAIQLLIGVVAAVRGPELAPAIGVAVGGALIFGMGALIVWGGWRLRRRSSR